MTTTIYHHVEQLLHYGIESNLITKWDIDVVRNKLLEILELDDFVPSEVSDPAEIELRELLDTILDWAAEHNLLVENTITYRDLLDTKLMACFVPLPSEINNRFAILYKDKGAKSATSWFYDFSKKIDYIRTDRIAKNEEWLAHTSYGDLEITINLSKPEKNPQEIAALKKVKQGFYPKCLLCKENAGYAGRVNHPARQNHRIIPVTLEGEQWFLQFSPYVYYNEHAICFSERHEPMTISKRTFTRLLEFVHQYPHYFMGSNADLPIVGGSILAHEHFQGGYHEFPMAKAEIEAGFTLERFPAIHAGIVKWPMSVLRLNGTDKQQLVEAADYILKKWLDYSDESVDILAYTNGVRHNTITPIARMRNGQYEMDLVLRNNRTSEEYPFGIFHPHEEVHAIKQENIGLIEVMGLAVLPGRLKEEMSILAENIVKVDFEERIQQEPAIVKHLAWAKTVKEKNPQMTKENVSTILQTEIGIVFETILHHAGVFKRNDNGTKAFYRFIETL
ncbi:UDP-glucose--hexose-1-phosphate uridylyltransferase [Niallia circulans]|jgi:UDPglucose--hexose-1-phosphate uridylyltransferase|uniref:UDP-glucose--hexose-1-phosphate uridylyltransferase n=1 Tax=Niallia TaxID=2837506 RepID=UPI000BA63BC0|nr:UDP-glucose--hexose-1-phosphate uridylyltransferase [Niallia circulans]MCM2982580.1 UDP-glucose--hexose-1-phosphate uridylyltransferase [Niallia circulans]MED5098791.1 UDP-glucose--hexose-1-phosphate uridylyltransferase [Niallia circulans]PAD88786.1 UDP-glucose--hexose-1-phosphate uridylyltransferase [Niallia circulans]